MKMQNGFSLIELMVTLAIAAIVLTIGVPSFQTYIQNNRQTIAVNELATALQLARNNAISRRSRAIVCKSANGTDCVTTGTWSQGWIVFDDANADNSHDAGEEIFRVHGAIPGNATLSGNATVTDRVAFKSQGTLDHPPGKITYCDSRGNSHATALVISLGGRVHFENNGSLLTC